MTKPAARSKPPARASINSRPPDTPPPPVPSIALPVTGVVGMDVAVAVGTGVRVGVVGMDVAVAVGTGVRVGVIVGGAVGVLVATMSYEPAEGGLVACGVGVRVGCAVACGVPACAVACGAAVGVSTGPGGGVGAGGDGVRGVGTVSGVRVGVASVPGGGVGDSPDVGVGVAVGVVGVAVGGSTVAVGVNVTVGAGVGVEVGGTGVCVGVTVGVAVGVAVGVGVGVNGTCTTSSVAGQFFPPGPTELVPSWVDPRFAAVNVDVRSNAVPTATLMTYGESIGAPSRTQIPLSSTVVQTTAIGSGGI